MKRISCWCGLLLLLSVSAPAFAHHMAVVVNKDNKADEVSSVELANIFRSEMTKWPDGTSIVLILHRNSSEEFQTLQHINKMSVTELKAHIAAHKDAIRLVDSDDVLLKLVEDTHGAIAMVGVRSINDHIKVVKVDGKLPLEAGYLPH
jgi:ABC-type phosphate transport system substrate-binding protein